MGIVANLAIRIGVNATDLEKTLASLGTQAKRLGSQMQSAGASLTAGITVPIAGIGAAAVAAGLSFEKSMNQIQGVMSPTAGQMEAIRAKAIEMGAATIFSAKDSADAMLELGKAGFTTEQALTGVKDVLQLAAASGLSMADAAELSARTMTSFGLKVTDLAHINDVMAKAVNSSTLEITDLQTAFGYIGPIASAFGMSIESATAALAIMRDSGIQADTAGRSLRQGLSRLINPVKAVQIAMEQLNITSFKDANGNLMSLSSIVGLLQERGMTAAQAMKLFGTESGPAMYALITGAKGGQANLDALTLSLQNSKGAAADMANAMMTGLPGAFEQLKGSVETALIAISKAMEPVLVPVLNGLTQLANFIAQTVVPAFQALPVPVQAGAIAFAALAAAVGPLLVVAGTLAMAWGQLVLVFPAIETAVATMGTAFGAFVSGVGPALVTFFTVTLPGAFGGVTTAIGAALAGDFAALAAFFTTTLPAAFGAVVAFLGPQGLIALGIIALGAIWYTWGDQITAVVQNVYNAAKTWLVDMWQDSIFQHLAQMLEAIGNLLVALGAKALEGAMAVFNAVKTWLVDRLTPVWEAIKVAAAALAAPFVAAATKIGTIVQQIFTAVKTWLLDKFSEIVQGIKNKIDAVTGFFNDMYKKVVGGSYVPDMIAGIQNCFGQLSTVMVGPTQTATSAVEGLFQSMTGKVTGWIDGLLNKIPGIGGALSQVFQSMGGVGGILDKILGGGKGAGGVGMGGGDFGGLLAKIPGIGKFFGGGAVGGGGGGLTGALSMAGPYGMAASLAIAGGKALYNKLSGGEEAHMVNPARDAYGLKFRGQYGGATNSDAVTRALEGAGLGGERAAALLQAFNSADTMQEFSAATEAIDAALASAKPQVDQFGNTVATSDTALQAMGAAMKTAVEGMVAGFNAATATVGQFSAALALASATIVPGGVTMGGGTIGGGEPALTAGDVIGSAPDASMFSSDTQSGNTAIVQAGTVIGNPDELAGYVLDTLESGGDAATRYRAINSQLTES